jgi:hypothetical protein
MKLPSILVIDYVSCARAGRGRHDSRSPLIMSGKRSPYRMQGSGSKANNGDVPGWM